MHLGGSNLELNAANIVSGFTLLRPTFGRRPDMESMLRVLFGVALRAIRFGRRTRSIEVWYRTAVGGFDLVACAKVGLSIRVQREYVRAWLLGRRSAFVASWVNRASLFSLDGSKFAPRDLVCRFV